MARRGRSKRGMALILALIAVVVVLGAVLLVSKQAGSAKFQTDLALTQLRLEEACKAGIDHGVERIWNDYVTGNGNTTGNLASYRVFIDSIVGKDETVSLISESNPVIIDDTQGISVTDVRLARTDDLDGTQLTITATGQVGGAVRTARQTILVSGTPFPGLEYAVLANYINCILCHAGIRNLEQEYNTETALYNTFDRVKVATLQALLFRQGSADSHVAGSVYTRGNVYNENGSVMSNASIASGKFRGRQFNNTNGKITQGAASPGAMVDTSLIAATVGTDGKPQQFANLYKNYPTDPDLMSDGPLPTTFPAPYPDNDNDRVVDDDEFNEIADVLEGAIKGGIVVGVPEGTTYDATALPTASSGSALNDLTTTGRYDGNLILVGTETNPILIDGEVAVDGDLVLAGRIKGKGQLFVRGNSYIVGDVTYKDVPTPPPGKKEAFGVNDGQGGVGNVNAFALVTGGSVLMGDYLTISRKAHSLDTSKHQNTAYSIDVRSQTKTATSTIKNSSGVNVTETMRYGYFDPGVVDAGEIKQYYDNTTTLRDGQNYSFTTSELMLFNNAEIDKAATDPNYKPRLYGLRETQPNNIYAYTKPAEEHATRYNEYGANVLSRSSVKLLPEYLTYKNYPANIATRATMHYMNPKNNWISEDNLRQIWYKDEMARANGAKWLFDGLLYSNNAIFAITRSASRHKSYTQGKMRVRGAIICPDLGVLCAGPDTAGTESFTLLYDKRIREFWAPQDRTRVFFQRQVYQVVHTPAT